MKQENKNSKSTQSSSHEATREFEEWEGRLDPLDPATNPLAGTFSPEPKLSDEQRAKLEAEQFRKEIEKEVQQRRNDEDTIQKQNAAEVDKLKSRYEDISHQYDEANIELAEAKKRLDDFKKSPTPTPVLKIALFEVQKMILKNLNPIKKMLGSYKGMHQSAVNDFLKKLNSKTDMNDLRVMLKDPVLLKEIQSLHANLRFAMESNRNIFKRRREKPLYDLLEQMPLDKLFDPDWVPNERRKLEGEVSAQQKLVENLGTLKAGLAKQLGNSDVKDKQVNTVTLKADDKKHLLTSSRSSMFSRPVLPKSKPDASLEKGEANERRSGLIRPRKGTSSSGS